MTTETSSSLSPDFIAEPTPNQKASRLIFWAMTVFVLAYCGTLLGAFGVQFGQHEYPCPLCMLQRYAMILTSIPILWILADSLRGQLNRSRYVSCLGMSIVAAIAGGVESTRQILLHIANSSDPGYGSAVLGLHLYTWALLTFEIVIAFCGIALMINSAAVPLAPSHVGQRRIARAVLLLFLAVVAANLIAVFCLEGFNWVLPDNPTRYNLFHQLGF